MEEHWKPIAGFESAYEVSNLGRVRSLQRITAAGKRGGCVMRMCKLRTGYLMVSLSACGKKKKFLLHHLVLNAFVGQRPPGTEARHWPSNDKTNCRLDNLQWADHTTNMRDRFAHNTYRRGSNHHGAVLSEASVMSIRTAFATGTTRTALAENYGVSNSTVEKIINKQIWRHV